MKKIIQAAVNYLKKGGVIVYPTETAYALGCDATNMWVVRRVFKIKKRPLGKTLPLIAGSLAMVKRYCRLAGLEQKLAKKHWPGPLTLILRYKTQKTRYKLAKGVMAKDKTVAIRVSGGKIARALSRRLGRPIISTSANLAGGGECYSVPEVKKQLGRQPEILILDGGRLKKRKPSTIAKIKDGRVEVLRQGSIKIKL